MVTQSAENGALLAENSMLREALTSARERERAAFQAVCWVVEASGGRVVVPHSVMVRDWRLTAEDTIDGGRRFITAEARSGASEGANHG